MEEEEEQEKRKISSRVCTEFRKETTGLLWLFTIVVNVTILYIIFRIVMIIIICFILLLTLYSSYRASLIVFCSSLIVY